MRAARMLVLVILAVLATGCSLFGIDYRVAESKINARMDAMEAAVASGEWNGFASHLKVYSGGHAWDVVDEAGNQDPDARQGWHSALDVAHYLRDGLAAETISFSTRSFSHYRDETVVRGRFEMVDVLGTHRDAQYTAYFSRRSDYRMFHLKLYFNQ